jgi:hypothetical protein
VKEEEEGGVGVNVEVDVEGGVKPEGDLNSAGPVVVAAECPAPERTGLGAGTRVGATNPIVIGPAAAAAAAAAVFVPILVLAARLALGN